MNFPILKKFFKSEKPISLLDKIDCSEINISKDEIYLFAILRNESLRLPHFIKYYKNIGVDKMFFVDNGSTDGSKEIILNESSAHLFYTEEDYKDHWFWMEYLLEMYGKGNWCLVVDIDELFSYPNIEFLKLRDLISYLENNKKNAIQSLLLDLYAKNSIKDAVYKNGGNPLEIIPYFDPSYQIIEYSFLNRKDKNFYKSKIFVGGMRERVFGKIDPPHILSKVSLLKYSSDVYLSQGMHAIDKASISEIQGVVFHTKFLNDFIEEVQTEVLRAQHYGGAMYYKHFATKINEEQITSLYDKHSVKFIDTNQLVALNLMVSSSAFEEYCLSLSN